MAVNLYNEKIIDERLMEAPITSKVNDLSLVQGYAIYAKWTGSPQGELKLRACVTDNPNDYIDIPGTTVVVNGAGDCLWEIDMVYHDKVVLQYTPSLGSGILNATINAKK